MAGIHLVLGGARSGKSRFAEQQVLSSGLKPVYVATAQAFDDEMRSRIAKHREDRDGSGWTTVEEPLDLIPVLQEWENSGDLESSDRLRRSLRVNGVFYLYMLLGGILALMLLWYFDVGSEMGLIIWLKCLATVWGIFLQIVMMGYAIVEIPRSLWLKANYQKYLKYCYSKIEEIEESRN